MNKDVCRVAVAIHTSSIIHVPLVACCLRSLSPSMFVVVPLNVVPVSFPFASLIWFPLVESLEKDEEKKEDEEEVKQEVVEDEVVKMDTDDDNQKSKSKIKFLEAEECCLKLHIRVTSNSTPLPPGI